MTNEEKRNIYNNIQNLYNMDFTTWQEVLAQLYNLVADINQKFDAVKEQFELMLGKEVANKLEEMYNDGSLEKLLNTQTLERIKQELLQIITTNKTEFDNFKNKITEQLDTIEKQIYIINNSMTIDSINNLLKKGGTFIFKNGTYLLEKGQSIIPSSNSRLIFEPNAILKYNDNTSTHYVMLEVYNIENVIIETPHLIGCRDTHIGSEGEWGYGIEIASSQNIKIIKPIVEKTWGDGIYIGYKWDSSGKLYNTKNIFVDGAFVNACSRNGISICSGDDITILNPLLVGIDRVEPRCGIDIEPENSIIKNIHLNNVNIINPITKNCGGGICIIDTYITTDCVINIDGHADYGSSSFKYYGRSTRQFTVNYSNADLISSNNAIRIEDKSINNILNLNNININGATKQLTNADLEYSSAIRILGTVTDREIGRININNLVINKNMKYSYGIGIACSSNSTNKIKYLIMKNYNGEGRTFNIAGLDLSTTKFENITNIMNTSYGSHFLNEEYISELNYSKIYEYNYTCTVNSMAMNGVYKIRLMGTDGDKNFTIKPNGVTFSPTNKNIVVWGVGEITLLKKDNIVYVMNITCDTNYYS